WPESTAQSLEDGYTIYTSRCSKCHDLKDIPSMSEQDWIKSIASMAPKARLSEAEKITLEHYILATREAAAVRK
ncbi:MAG: cytochrome c, partial [Crocinitomicaceae bacterium]|nr:cytochrome c [Crocinitomicaceae bacterium]